MVGACSFDWNDNVLTDYAEQRVTTDKRVLEGSLCSLGCIRFS